MKSANEWRKQFYGNGEVLRCVNDLMIFIEDEIKKAIERQDSQIIVPLPSDYLVGSMNRKTAQKYIFGTLIKEMEKLGYEIALRFKEVGRNVEVSARITWLNENDKIYEDKLDKLISKHTY